MRFKVRFQAPALEGELWAVTWWAREDSQQGETMQNVGVLRMSGTQARGLQANCSFMGIETLVESDTGKIEGA